MSTKGYDYLSIYPSTYHIYLSIYLIIYLSKVEDHTGAEQKEEKELLAEIMNTRVMKETYNFLRNSNFIICWWKSLDTARLRQLIKIYQSFKANKTIERTCS